MQACQSEENIHCCSLLRVQGRSRSNFTSLSLETSLQSKHYEKKSIDEAISGRNIYDLATTFNQNIKKVLSISEEWLTNKRKPS